MPRWIDADALLVHLLGKVEVEVDRIQRNIDRSFEALRRNGVDVPIGAKSDTLPELIEQLAARTKFDLEENK